MSTDMTTAPLGAELAKVRLLKPMQLKNAGGTVLSHGFLITDVQQVEPDIVRPALTNPLRPNPLAATYQNPTTIVPMLVKAVQELADLYYTIPPIKRVVQDVSQVTYQGTLLGTAEQIIFNQNLVPTDWDLNGEIRLRCEVAVATVASVASFSFKAKLGSGQNQVILTLTAGNITLSTNGLAIIDLTLTKKASKQQFVRGIVRSSTLFAKTYYDGFADWTIDDTINQPLVVTFQLGGVTVGATVTTKLSRLEVK